MIYFIRNTRTGHVKIGLSDDPKQRLGALQTASHDPLVLMGAVPGNVRDERKLHRRFTQIRVRGEWFHGKPVLMAFIKAALAHPGTWQVDAASRKSRSLLTGMFFHSREPDRSIAWQGRILRVREDMVLVETYSWLDGSGSVKRLVSLADVKGWDLYETDLEMRVAYDRQNGASPREIEANERCRQALENVMNGRMPW